MGSNGSWEDTALHRAVDDARADQVARARSRERWLRRQAQEAAEFTGTLLDLLERRIPVVVRTSAGTRHRGWLAGLGRDVVAIRTPAGQRVWLRLTAVTAVTPDARVGLPDADDERTEREDVEFAEVLGRLSERRPRLVVRTQGATQPISGELRSAGADVLTLIEGDRPCYVSLPSVVEVSLLDSG